MIYISIVLVILFALVMKLTVTKRVHVYGIVIYDSNGKWEYTKYVQATSFKNAERKVKGKMKPGQTYKIEPL